jgi:hypothetical protein
MHRHISFSGALAILAVLAAAGCRQASPPPGAVAHGTETVVLAVSGMT